MAILSYKAFKVLTRRILCGLLEIDQVTGFNNLVQKIIDVKVKENCNKKVISSN